MKTLLAVLLLLLSVTPAHAQAQCGNRLAIIKMLAAKHKESPKFIAIAGEKNLVEIFISKSGSWTMLVTQPQGKTCIFAGGDSWDELPSVTILDEHDT